MKKGRGLLSRVDNRYLSSFQQLFCFGVLFVVFGVFCYVCFERKTPLIDFKSSLLHDIEPMYWEGGNGDNVRELDKMGKKMQEMLPRYLKEADTLYVIPGGGSGLGEGYPEWTRRRVLAAYTHSEGP